MTKTRREIDHRAVTLKFLKSTGLIPVKIRPGQKDAFPEWDPRRAGQEDHTGTLALLENEPSLNIAALMTGRYVDIDIDCTSILLKDALHYFLPRTPYVFGRKSKPKSHRIYALHEDFDRGPWSGVLRYIKNLKPGVIDDESYSIEVRGGKAENGLYTVLPGSRRSDVNENIEWDHEIDPTVGGAYVKIEALIKAVRLSIVVAAIAPHWVEGVRNDMSLALAGTLWRIRTSTLAAFGLEPDDEAPAGYYVLTEDDAKAIVGLICDLAGDDPTDKRDRLTNLKNTWQKLDGETGAKVTGGKVLAELIGGDVGPKVVKSLYRLLSDNDAAEAIEKMAEQFVMWYGPGVILDLEQVKAGRITPWMTKEQATNSLGGKKLAIGDKKIPIANMLFGSSIINRVMGLTFDPSQEELVVQTPEGLMVNQWRGWGTVPAGQRVTKEEIEPFYDYVLNIVADGVQERAEWVFAWMADMLQQPHKKPGTALVLVGVQGAGKTFLGEHILGKIVGPSHYGQINSIEQLTSKFNTGIDNKVFLQCDEAVHSYQRDVASRLKSIISDGTLVIEPKGINSYRKPNHLHLLFTSNEETTAIFIDPSPYERRFTVLKVSAAKAQDLDYWSFMHLWTPTALPKIMRWLMDYKYDRTLVSRPILTEAKQDVQRVGVDAEVSWILSRMASGFALGKRSHRNWFDAFHTEHITEADKKNNVLVRDVWPDRIQISVLEEDFKNYIREHGRTVYSGSVLTNMKRVFPKDGIKAVAQMSVRVVDQKSGQAVVERVRLHSLPSMQDIMTHLFARYGPVVNSMFEDLKQGTQQEDLPELAAPPHEEEEF